MTCGVYEIKLLDSKKSYIGSSYDIERRIKNHINLLDNGKHSNSILQSLWEQSFQINILEQCLEQDLLSREEYYIASNSDCISTFPYSDHTSLFSEKLKEKILSKIKKENECWIYTGAIKNGYGRIHVSQKTLLVHRIMYYFYKNEYPYLVRHICGNRACCNPEHLQQGSFRDNALDNNRDFRNRFIESYKKNSGSCKKVSLELGIKKEAFYRYRRSLFPEYVPNKNKKITAFGETKSIKEWLIDKRCGKNVSRQLLLTRLRKWPPEKAISTNRFKKPKTIITQTIEESFGLWLYGYPISSIIPQNRDLIYQKNDSDFVKPQDLSRYTFFLSLCGNINIHMRRGRFYYVIGNKISSGNDTYRDCLYQLCCVSGDVRAISEYESMFGKFLDRKSPTPAFCR